MITSTEHEESPGTARDDLRARLMAVHRAIHDYPRPVAGCDQQFNHLLQERDRIARELARTPATAPGGPSA